MNVEYVIVVAARFLHLISAALAIGVPIYIRLVLLPAMAKLDDAQRSTLREAIHARWRIIVHILIAIFLLTGFYNFLVVARWKTLPPEAKSAYHMIFGIKFCLALVMFFLSSALVGRSAKLAFIRSQPKRWVTVLAALGLIVLLLSNNLRFL